MRPVVSIYCNGCGALFSSPDHYRRFCSTGCASRFWRGVDRRLATRSRAVTQDRILAALRRRDGDWIERSDIVAAVYGTDDQASRRAFTSGLHRLRAMWGDLGLVIVCRVDRMALDRVSATHYRLEQDITTEEVAS